MIHNWIPEQWIEKILGNDNPFGVILAVLVGVPMYADIFWNDTGSRSASFKGSTAWNNFKFYDGCDNVKSAVYDHAAKAVKPKLLAAFATICTTGIVMVGYLFNLFQSVFLLREGEENE